MAITQLLEGTMTKKQRSQPRPRGAKLYRWSLQDEVFFDRYQELSNDQVRFYLGLRKAWIQQGGASLIVEQSGIGPEFADAMKGVQGLCDRGFILREDARAIGRRILAEVELP